MKALDLQPDELLKFVSQWRWPEKGHTWAESAPGAWWLTDGLPHHPPRYRAYAPLVDYTGLFLTFADTAPTPEGILTFANAYGLLGLRPQGLVCAPVGEGHGIEQWGEAQEDWMKAILTMRHTVTLWEWARQNDSASLSQQISWDEHSLVWIDTHPEFSAQEKQSDGAYAINHLGHTYLRAGFLHHLHYEGTAPPQLHVCERVTHPGAMPIAAGDVASAALWYVQHVITAHLWESAKPCMAWDQATHHSSLCVRVETLLSALWVQFALAVTGQKTYRQCQDKACRIWFEVSPAKGRADKKYCSHTCRTRAYRERMAQAAQRA
jgi:hypothetical protein